MISRQDFRRLALEWAGREWDSMQARDAEHLARVQALRDAEAERVRARCEREAAEHGIWLARAAAAGEAYDAAHPAELGPRLERRLRVVKASRALRDSEIARLTTQRHAGYPCDVCGYAYGHCAHGKERADFMSAWRAVMR